MAAGEDGGRGGCTVTMFMEEFWNNHTHPGVLRGTVAFSLPGDR